MDADADADVISDSVMDVGCGTVAAGENAAEVVAGAAVFVDAAVDCWWERSGVGVAVSLMVVWWEG